MAVRDLGRPTAVTLWLRKVGLEEQAKTVIVPDKEIGRWQQWRKVVERRMRRLLRRADLFARRA